MAAGAWGAAARRSTAVTIRGSFTCPPPPLTSQSRTAGRSARTRATDSHSLAQSVRPKNWTPSKRAPGPRSTASHGVVMRAVVVLVHRLYDGSAACAGVVAAFVTPDVAPSVARDSGPPISVSAGEPRTGLDSAMFTVSLDPGGGSGTAKPAGASAYRSFATPAAVSPPKTYSTEPSGPGAAAAEWRGDGAPAAADGVNHVAGDAAFRLGSIRRTDVSGRRVPAGDTPPDTTKHAVVALQLGRKVPAARERAVGGVPDVATAVHVRVA